MSQSSRPRLRRIDSFPISQPNGEIVFALRDPEGFSGSIVLPYAAAAALSLVDGTRTLPEIQADYRRRFSQDLDSEALEQLLHDLDDRLYLDTPRFRAQWKQAVEKYLNGPSRSAAHAGSAYAADAGALRQQLESLFVGVKGPGAPAEPPDASSGLRGVLSPHIDLQRGGTALASAYKRLIEQSDAELFVIFGTAHSPLGNLFSVSKKHFETPLGTVETDRAFIGKLSHNLAAEPGGKLLNPYADELAHRQEHSLEFQVLFLQYLLAGRRPFKVVPVLAGSFHEFVASRKSPAESPAVQAFIAAMQKTAGQYPARIAYISAGDLAHIGQRFGDREFLNAARLKRQSEHDHELLAAACRADADAFFHHVAAQDDRHRVCGLSPTYTMLQVMRPSRGELLTYDQAVELDGTACVSFASLAFYDR